jgi:hypothetical protein
MLGVIYAVQSVVMLNVVILSVIMLCVTYAECLK